MSLFKENYSAGTPPLDNPHSCLVSVLFVRMLSVFVIQLYVSFEWRAVLFMVSSGRVCRQVVGRWSPVQTPTLLTLPVSSSSNTHLLFSFLLSSKMSWNSQLTLVTPYSSSLSYNTPETLFITVNSKLVSTTSLDLMILGLLIFSLPLPPHFSSTPLHRLYLIAFWPRGQHFYVMLLPPRKMLTALWSF